MTKAELMNRVVKTTGIEKTLAQKSVEAFLIAVRESLGKGEPVFLRGFGSFIIKKRAKKIARNIRTNTAIVVPEHNIVAIRPSRGLANAVRTNTKVKQ